MGEECLNLGERNNGGIAFEVNDNPGPASPPDDVIGEFASEQDGFVQVVMVGKVFGSVWMDMGSIQRIDLRRQCSFRSRSFGL